MLTLKEKMALTSFKNSLKRSLEDNLVSIQLFGSKARGDFRKDSDTDVLLVINKKTHLVEETIYNTVIDLMLKTGFYFSVKIFDLKEFEKLNKVPTVFMQKFAQEAKKI